MTWQLLTGDCVEVMRGMEPASVDAIVTDPPYGIGFMGKEWDGFSPAALAVKTANHQPIDHKLQAERSASMHAGQYDLSLSGNGRFQAWCTTWAAEALRVLKPGGHLLSFGGTRTYHRLACALEDAGFEIRDCLAWLYGSGFPKSLDVSKAIDKAAGAAREDVLQDREPTMTNEVYGKGLGVGIVERRPATPDAERWQGWGTALKPAFEPIVLARKPLSGTVAANVLEHGVGALNVDGTRIGTDGGTASESRGEQQGVTYANGALSGDYGERVPGLGRWPANVLLDAEAAAALDEQSGEKRSAYTGSASPDARIPHPSEVKERDGFLAGITAKGLLYADSGGASRFFYTAKTSRSERENGAAYGEDRNSHPTVKPVDLMCWLCRLITPPKGLILDPFTGSGSTGIAALREGFSFIGIEREPEYVEIARARIIGDAPLFNAEEVIAEDISP